MTTVAENLQAMDVLLNRVAWILTALAENLKYLRADLVGGMSSDPGFHEEERAN